MKNHTRLRWAALALTLILAGCGGGMESHDTAEVSAQAVDGKLTEAMCGLLTRVDLAESGKDVGMLDQVSAHLRSDGRDLNCSYLLGLDGFTMNLQPTAEAGKLRFAQFLGWHKGALESMGETQDRRWPSQAGQFLADVVPGADESWFDLSAMSTDQYPRYELVARQGGLLIGLELSTLTDAETDQPTLAVQRMADLAGLLLQRVPSLGKTDTGTTLVGQYEVYGQGSVNISYADPTTAPDFIELAAVPLPWFVNIPMATPSEGEIPFLGISAWRSQPFTQVGCRILLNGTVVDEQQQSSAVFCDAAGLDFSR